MPACHDVPTPGRLSVRTTMRLYSHIYAHRKNHHIIRQRHRYRYRTLIAFKRNNPYHIRQPCQIPASHLRAPLADCRQNYESWSTMRFSAPPESSRRGGASRLRSAEISCCNLKSTSRHHLSIRPFSPRTKGYTAKHWIRLQGKGCPRQHHGIQDAPTQCWIQGSCEKDRDR